MGEEAHRQESVGRDVEHGEEKLRDCCNNCQPSARRIRRELIHQHGIAKSRKRLLLPPILQTQPQRRRRQTQREHPTHEPKHPASDRRRLEPAMRLLGPARGLAQAPALALDVGLGDEAGALGGGIGLGEEAGEGVAEGDEGVERGAGDGEDEREEEEEVEDGDDAEEGAADGEGGGRRGGGRGEAVGDDRGDGVGHPAQLAEELGNGRFRGGGLEERVVVQAASVDDDKDGVVGRLPQIVKYVDALLGLESRHAIATCQRLDACELSSRHFARVVSRAIKRRPVDKGR